MMRFGRHTVVVGLCLFLATACAPHRRQPTSPAGPTAAGNAPDVSAVVSGVYQLGQALEQERAHSASLERQLDERAQEVQNLRAEVAQLKTSPAVPDATGGAASAATAPAPPPTSVAASPEASGAPPPAPTPAAQAVATLRTELAQERKRRVVAEDELARLKQETSTSPYEKRASPPTQLEALVVAKQQVVALQNALADERQERERLAEELHALEARATAAPAGDAALRAQLEALQREKDSLIDAFNRSLAESQRRSAELEQSLTAARAQGGSETGGAASASLRAENDSLRQRLEDERRRTEDLAAKLRAATRVADLIFKMQAQEAPATGVPAGRPPAARPPGAASAPPQ